MTLKHWWWAPFLAVSCRPAATGAVPPGGDPCRIPAAATGLDTLNVGFSEGENEGGRLLLRLTGQTLIRVDCEGRIHPALARTWTRDAAGTTWTFTLDSTIQATSLLSQWDLRRNGGLWAWAHILEAAAPAPDQLTVRLDSVFPDVPAAFAQPGLSVTPSVLPSAPPARIQIYPPGVDQRDLLDLRTALSPRGLDILLTRDPAVVNYARSKPDFSVIPLAWDRTYVLVAPVTPPDLESQGTDFRASLAREVVRGDARASVGPWWWDRSPCRGTVPLRPMGRLRLVVYVEGDETGRALAERMVALERTPLRAASLPPAEFAASLSGGEAALYVLSLSRIGPGNCAGVPAWPSAARVLPLVDVRPHLLLRAGVPAITLEADGSFRFDHPLIVIPTPGRAR